MPLVEYRQHIAKKPPSSTASNVLKSETQHVWTRRCCGVLPAKQYPDLRDCNRSVGSVRTCSWSFYSVAFNLRDGTALKSALHPDQTSASLYCPAAGATTRHSCEHEPVPPCTTCEPHASMPLSCFQVMVAEPNVSDTINILRGLSERYSSFHGVRIADRCAFGSCTSGACQTSDGPQYKADAVGEPAQ